MRARLENLGGALATRSYSAVVGLTDQLGQLNSETAGSWRGYRAYALEELAKNETDSEIRASRRRQAAQEYKTLLDGGMRTVEVPNGVPNQYYELQTNNRYSALQMRMANLDHLFR